MIETGPLCQPDQIKLMIKVSIWGQLQFYRVKTKHCSLKGSNAVLQIHVWDV